jgi:hypothetical protein
MAYVWLDGERDGADAIELRRVVSLGAYLWAG